MQAEGSTLDITNGATQTQTWYSEHSRGGPTWLGTMAFQYLFAPLHGGPTWLGTLAFYLFLYILSRHV